MTTTTDTLQGAQVPETTPPRPFATVHCPTCGVRPITEFQAEFEARSEVPLYGLTTIWELVVDERREQRFQPSLVLIRHIECGGLAASLTRKVERPMILRDREAAACGYCGKEIDWPIQTYLVNEYGRVHTTCSMSAHPPVSLDAAIENLRSIVMRIGEGIPDAPVVQLDELLETAQAVLMAVESES